jgi:hypothetical protein
MEDAVAQYDVFLSYRSTNGNAVQDLYDCFVEAGLRPWFDRVEIRDGDVIFTRLAEGLRASRIVIAIVGADGGGPYQDEELWASIAQSIKTGLRVIPVLLPGANEVDLQNVHPFLANRRWRKLNRIEPDDADVTALIRSIDPSKSLPTARVPQREPRALQADGSDAALTNLVASVSRFGSLTVFTSAGAASSSRPYELARQLLTDIRFIEPQYTALLPSLDVASSYYETDASALRLEARVVELIRDKVRGDPLTAVAKLHGRLVDLVEQLVRLAAERARRQSVVDPPLIVTTALDVSFERAFLRAGTPFTRIVQHWSGSELTINDYAVVKLSEDRKRIGIDQAADFRIDDLPSLDQAIETTGLRSVKSHDELSETSHPIRDLALSQIQPGAQIRPILYKYHGSQDVPGSCALSTDQYLRLAVRQVIPKRLIQMIGNSSALFLPSGGLDADVRHAYHTLLRRAYQIGREGLARFAVVRPPTDGELDNYRQLERLIWPNVIKAVQSQMNIGVVEGDPEAFVEQLTDKLKEVRP